MDSDFCPHASLKKLCTSMPVSRDRHLRPGKRKDYTHPEEEEYVPWIFTTAARQQDSGKDVIKTFKSSHAQSASTSKDSLKPEAMKPEVIELSDTEVAESHVSTTKSLSRRYVHSLIVANEMDSLEKSLSTSQALLNIQKASATAWEDQVNTANEKIASIQKELDDYKTQTEATISETESRVGSLVNELNRLKTNNDASTTAYKHTISFLALRPLTLQSRYARSYQFELPSNSGEYEVIVNQFKNRVAKHRPAFGIPHQESPIYENIRVYRICNPRLWAKYESEVDDIYGLCNGTAKFITKFSETEEVLHAPTLHVQDKFNPMNECWLFHGVPTALKDRISQQGIDPRYAGTHFGKLYGYGSYFAELSSKSDIYTKPDDNGTRCMFFCRVCLGEIHEAKNTLETIRMPPERSDNRGPYNSVKAATLHYGGRVEYPEYIVYLTNQVYPEFRIEYRHSLSCKCTHCKK